MKEKKYTYPRVHLQRKMIKADDETPVVSLIFSTIVIDKNNKERVEQLVAFYPFFGKRDVECEVDAANTFHNMCRDAYFGIEDETTEDDIVHNEIDESNINFNEDDERW